MIQFFGSSIHGDPVHWGRLPIAGAHNSLQFHPQICDLSDQIQNRWLEALQRLDHFGRPNSNISQDSKNNFCPEEMRTPEDLEQGLIFYVNPFWFAILSGLGPCNKSDCGLSLEYNTKVQKSLLRWQRQCDFFAFIDLQRVWTSTVDICRHFRHLKCAGQSFHDISKVPEVTSHWNPSMSLIGCHKIYIEM